MRQLYFYAPLVVSALCIFRAISLWAEESLEPQKGPNQPIQPVQRTGAGARR